MKSLSELLIQSLHDTVAFEDGELDARINVRELTVREAKSGKKPEILQRKVHLHAKSDAN